MKKIIKKGSTYKIQDENEWLPSAEWEVIREGLRAEEAENELHELRNPATTMESWFAQLPKKAQESFIKSNPDLNFYKK